MYILCFGRPNIPFISVATLFFFLLIFLCVFHNFIFVCLMASASSFELLLNFFVQCSLCVVFRYLLFAYLIFSASSVAYLPSRDVSYAFSVYSFSCIHRTHKLKHLPETNFFVHSKIFPVLSS